MDKQRLIQKNDLGSLPLVSLRLLVPPLRMLYAFLWRVVQHRCVAQYGMVEELVSMVTGMVPQLLGYRQQAQLILGLKARVVLELCRDPADIHTIQAHLDAFHIPPVPPGSTAGVDADVEASVANFKALVNALLKDPLERAYFFQEVFPSQYGPRYDTALRELLWKLLSGLEQLLPEPDIKEMVSLITPAPTGLEECVQSVSEDLKALLQQRELFRSVDMLPTPFSMGDCILSSLSIPPSVRVMVTNKPTAYHFPSSSVTVATPAVLGELGAETIIVTDYSEVELSTSVDAEMIVVIEDSQSEPGKVTDEGIAVTAEHAYVERDPGVEEAESGEREASRHNEEVVSSCEEVELALTGRSQQSHSAQTQEVSDDREEMPAGPSEVQPEEADSGGVRLGEEMTEERGEELRAAENGDGDGGVSGDVAEPVPADGGQQEVVQEVEQEVVQEVGEEDSGQHTAAPLRRSGRQRRTSHRLLQAQVQRDKRSKNNQEAASATTPLKRPSRNAKNAKDEDASEDNSAKASEAEQNGSDPAAPPSGRYRTRNSRKPLPASPRGGRGPRGSAHAPFTCSDCGRSFTRSSDVRRHQLTHTGERPFHCTRCDKTFQHAWDLTKHGRKFHGEGQFSCRLCGQSFVNLRVLTAHHKQSHGAAELPHYCSICGEDLPSAPALVDHRKTHSATQQYKCLQCGEGFDTLLERSKHRQTHARRHFKCPQCDKMYTRRSDVTRHQLTHTGERPHQCAQCGKSFGLRTGLKKHQMVHTGERPYQCRHCPKRFTLISILARHERMHTGERPFLCSQCGKRFLSLGELSKHHQSHTDERPHACTQCHKRFKSKRALREHELAHTGARPYPCGYCDKMFSKPFALARHHLMHTGERPFSCSHCERTFLTATEQVLHERIHTGEKPYCCAECPMKFRSSSELARHKRSHTGERPFCCSYCPKTYRSSAKLKNHVRVHTGEKAAKAALGHGLLEEHAVQEMQQETVGEEEVVIALTEKSESF